MQLQVQMLRDHVSANAQHHLVLPNLKSSATMFMKYREECWARAYLGNKTIQCLLFCDWYVSEPDTDLLNVLCLQVIKKHRNLLLFCSLSRIFHLKLHKPQGLECLQDAALVRILQLEQISVANGSAK